jgi:hypothetical protein
MNVDMREAAMSWFHARRVGEVRVCERCGEVCGGRCVADAARRRALDRLREQGWRLA